MEHWYVSDTHFGHTNIIRFCKRPFADEWEMDEALINRWNEVVRPEDHVNHLGDVTMARGGRVQQDQFKALVARLNGHKRLFLGNHDHFPIQTYLEAGFEKVYATWRTESGLLLSHIPIHPNSLGSARANVHGHTHSEPDYAPHIVSGHDGKLRIIPFVNISVEHTEYRPINLDEVNKRVQAAIEAYQPS